MEVSNQHNYPENILIWSGMNYCLVGLSSLAACSSSSQLTYTLGTRYVISLQKLYKNVHNGEICELGKVSTVSQHSMSECKYLDLVTYHRPTY